MSRTLIHRTNKEFDKCAELLRSLLSVQAQNKESRQDSKSPTVRKINRKKPTQSSTNPGAKKANNKITVTKSSVVKTNINNTIETGEGRSSYSPNKVLHSTIEESSVSKNRSSPNKIRKYLTRSPSPPQRVTSPIKNSLLINNNSRQKSSPSSLRRLLPDNDEELVRSSSCGDLPSLKSNQMYQERTRLIRDQFIIYLTRIRTISKQIRMRHSNTVHDSECNHLWNELEKSLSSALSYHKQIQFSLTPLHHEIIELRKQLQTTNVHLHEYDRLRRNNDQYVHLQKKFDTNQIQCSQLLLHNEELKSKCYLLQDQLDHSERNNTHLIQRLTEQNLCSKSKHTERNSSDKRFLLREEISILKEKLDDVYDDLSTVLNRNQTLQNSIREQKQQISTYKQQLNDLKQSAQQLLRDLDSRAVEEKIKRFLNNILLDQHDNRISKSSLGKIPPTIVNTSSSFFETTQKSEVTSASIQLVRTRIPASGNIKNNKLRPQSLFITPNVLNDSNALFKLQNNHNVNFDRTQCSSSSTIDDADSTITSSSSSSTSLAHQQRKRANLYNSLPSLVLPTMSTRYQQNNPNESGPELDQISDLTSKMFGSGDEEMNISTTSSSSISSDAKKLSYM